MLTYKDYLVSWLQDNAKQANISGFLVGVSGGIDSAVVAQLATETGLKTTLISMPIEQDKDEESDADKILNHIGGNTMKIDLTDTFNALQKANNFTCKLAKANSKARLRMTTLYGYAAQEGLLVLGTDNFAEYMTGYFTKYGDGACDLLPISQLSKGEVKELAKVLKLPQFVIEKKPTAGLWKGQTDEEELGVSYEAIDNYSFGKEVDTKDQQTIENLIKKSAHKRNPIPMPKAYNKKIKL